MKSNKELSRRGLLTTLGMGIGSLAIARYLPVNEIESAMRAGAVSDVDILNFALNLEYL